MDPGDNASELHADLRRSGLVHSVEHLVELTGVELELDAMAGESQATSTRLRHLAGQHLALTAAHRTTGDIHAVIDLELGRVAGPTSH